MSCPTTDYSDLSPDYSHAGLSIYFSKGAHNNVNAGIRLISSLTKMCVEFRRLKMSHMIKTFRKSNVIIGAIRRLCFIPSYEHRQKKKKKISAHNFNH